MELLNDCFQQVSLTHHLIRHWSHKQTAPPQSCAIGWSSVAIEACQNTLNKQAIFDITTLLLNQPTNGIL